jgi:predicted kinase
MYGDENIQGDGKRVFEFAHHDIKGYGNRGENVVFDATNIDRKTRIKLVEEMRPYFDIIICKYFSTPLYICKIRNRERERQVPEEVLENMERRFRAPTLDEGFDIVEEIKNYL